VSSCGSKCTSNRLEDIKEDSDLNGLPATCPPPETPTESMEFLARSWSLSALELSNALTHTSGDHVQKSASPFLRDVQAQSGISVISKENVSVS
jgi:hypothetical protein